MRILIVILLTAFSSQVWCQQVMYLNSAWKKTIKAKAVYKSTITPIESEGLNSIKVDFYPSGKPWSKGTYNKKMPALADAEGLVQWFFADGRTSQRTSYHTGLKEGLSTLYFENGNKKSEKNYLHDKLNGAAVYFSEQEDTTAIRYYLADSLHGPYLLFTKTGSPFLVANYVEGKRDGEYTLYFGDDSLDQTGVFSNDKKTGEWLFYHKNGKLASRELYEMGIIKEAFIFDEDGNAQPLPDSLQVLEQDVEYRGGFGVLYREIAQRLKYPPEALENNVQGKVFVKITLDKNGHIIDSNVVSDYLGYGLDEIAVSVIEKLDGWLPVVNHNRNHPVEIRIPVNFKLK